MPNRTLIVSMLLPAYLLLVLHSVIPHHHHAPALNGPVQYHHGSHVHQADDPGYGEEDDHQDHCPSSHFVHAPDFGHAMLRSDADLIFQVQPVACAVASVRFVEDPVAPVHFRQAFYYKIPAVYSGNGYCRFERGPPHA